MKEPKLQTLVYKKIPYKDKIPEVKSIFIAPNCFLVGNVILKERSSVWFGTTCRGDTSICQIGKGSAVLENSFVENSLIGDDTMLSHGVIAHKCKVGNNVLVGISARILNEAEIGDNTMIGAGALILPNMKIPPNSVVIGKGKIARNIQEKDFIYIKKSIQEIQEKAKVLSEVLKKQI